MPPTHRPPCVYRLYSADRLLYVGISSDWWKRLTRHSRKAWWPDVTHGTIQPYPAPGHAALAEYQAMQEENPVHNILPMGPPFGYGSILPVPSAPQSPIPDGDLAALQRG